MSDPRNVAHDKKVEQEKKHHPATEEAPPKERVENDAAPAEANANDAPEPSVDFEKSQTVLSKLKEMEFHSRANIETLAGLTLTIDDELKQKEFSEAVGQLYAAQDGFHAKIAELIPRYEAKCDSLKPKA